MWSLNLRGEVVVLASEWRNRLFCDRIRRVFFKGVARRETVQPQANNNSKRSKDPGLRSGRLTERFEVLASEWRNRLYGVC